MKIKIFNNFKLSTAVLCHLRSLAVVDGVYEPEVMDGGVLQEVFRIIKLDIDSGQLDARHNAGCGGVDPILGDF